MMAAASGGSRAAPTIALNNARIVIPAQAGIQSFQALTGCANFINEVQHLIMVLLWEKDMTISPLKSDVKWPVYVVPGKSTGKSRQLWIARHRQLLAR
jgi:hypothetical protein